MCWLGFFYAHAQDAHALQFQEMLWREVGTGKAFLELTAVEAVLTRVEQNVPGNEILVERRVELFKKIGAPVLKHPGNFCKGLSPVLYVVKDTKSENGIQAAIAKRQIFSIGQG